MLTASRICFAIAIALIAVVGILHITTTEEPPFGLAITVHDGDRDLGTLGSGEHTIAFRITNASSLPLRVLGMHEA
jgi:hypothetical protein